MGDISRDQRGEERLHVYGSVCECAFVGQVGVQQGHNAASALEALEWIREGAAPTAHRQTNSAQWRVGD